MHKRFQLGVGFAGELAHAIEAGQQGGYRFSFIGENEIVIAGFACILIQLEIAPTRGSGLVRVFGVVQVAVFGKVRIEIGEFSCIVILLIAEKALLTKTTRRIYFHLEDDKGIHNPRNDKASVQNNHFEKI